MRFRYTFLLFSLLFNQSVSGQQGSQNWCGYTGDSEWLDWYQRHTGIFNISDRGNADTNWLYVPITAHIIGQNNGNGYIALQELLNSVCEMNDLYAPARIRYYLLPGDAIRYHNNSNWYMHDWSGGENMIMTVTPSIKDRLNAFVVGDPAGNCGYAWHDAIVLKNGCSGSGNTTWAHEAGHHFSLPHPFRGWEGFTWDYARPAPAKVNNRDVEKTNGSNCYTGGDRFCDTEPDYLNDRWPCNGNGRSNTLQHDPDSITFRSDASLIMGYAHDACASRFSDEQIAAVRANLQDEHISYLQINTPLPDLNDDDQVVLVGPVDSSESVQYNHIELKWNKLPGARYYTVEISRTPTFSVMYFSETVVDVNHIMVNKPMPNNWTLYWRVRAYSDWDLCQPYDKAQIGSFRTQNLSAVNELERTAVITLIPNLVASGVPAVLRIETEQTMDLAVAMCDATGRVLSQNRYRLYAGTNQFEVPTDDLSAGIYTVLLQNEKGATVKRLVVVE